MDADDFFAVVDGQVIALEPQRELPTDFLHAIARRLDTVFAERCLTIGGWDNPADGPLVLAITKTGQLVSVISVNPTQAKSLDQTITSIDQWLATLKLPDLSELSGNSVEFYEGLLELSPDSSIMLSSRRRYVLLTGMDELDLADLGINTGDVDIDVRYLDVLQAPGGPAIVRQRIGQVLAHTSAATPAADFAPVDLPRVSIEPAPAIPEDIEPLENASVTPAGDSSARALDLAPLEGIGHNADNYEITTTEALLNEAGLDDLAEQDDGSILDDVVLDNVTETKPDHEDTASMIDLTQEESAVPVLNLEPPSVESHGVELEAGQTFDLDILPLLFDATGSTLESISNELFAVNDAIVVVVPLPERRRDTPFEDRRRFRWDTSLDRIQLLNDHSFSQDDVKRTVHLFVESDRQPDYAVYVGELSRTAFQTQADTDGETAWFSITPSLSPDLYRTLRKGRLPQHERRTVDINDA